MQEWDDTKSDFVPTLFQRLVLSVSPSLNAYVEHCKVSAAFAESTLRRSQIICRKHELTISEKSSSISKLIHEKVLLQEDYKINLNRYESKVLQLTAQLNEVTRDAVSTDVEKKMPHVAKRGIICMPITLGKVSGYIYGGPYKQRPPEIGVGVKMAAEIHKPCEIDIPTKDFCVPDIHQFKLGLMEGLLHFYKQGELYVGCMGGIGRTGLYMAGIAEVLFFINELDMSGIKKVKGIPASIAYVRNYYKGNAVETEEQINFIKNLDVSGIVSALRAADIA